MRSPRLGTAFLVVALLLAASGQPPDTASAQGTGKTGGQVVLPMVANPGTMNPIFASSVAEVALAKVLFNGLTRFNAETFVPEPMLASKWEISPDGLVWTFHLRNGVKWHDGQPLTADDVKFTMDTIMDPKLATRAGRSFSLLKSTDVVDKSTVKFTMSAPFPAFPAYLANGFQVAPKHLLAGRDIQNYTEFNKRKPIGTGAFKMVENVVGDHIALEANPDFFLGRPKLDRVIFKVLPDANTQVAQLKTGEIDLMPRVDVSVAPSIQGTKGVRIDTGLVPQFWALHLNHDFPLFTDKKVRQAIAYAIDREALIRDVLYGQGRVAAGPIAPILTWAFNPNVKAYPYDPAKSKVLLQEAGWTDTNGDGVIDKDGKPFSFTLQILKGFPVAERTSAILQQSFKSLGMDAKLQAYEFASFITDVRDTRQGPKMSQAYVVFMLLAPEPDDIWAYFHSSNTAKGSNFNNYRNPEVDRLLDLARSSQDRGARRNAYFKIQEILHDDVARDFLFYPNEIYAMKSGLRGVPVTGPYPYVEQWHWE